MSTREILDRRFRWGLFGFLYPAVATALYVYLVPSDTTRVVSTGVIFFVMAAAIVYRWLTPCVQCGKALGWMAVTWMPWTGKTTSPSCPHCGVSIDRDAPS